MSLPLSMTKAAIDDLEDALHQSQAAINRARETPAHQRARQAQFTADRNPGQRTAAQKKRDDLLAQVRAGRRRAPNPDNPHDPSDTMTDWLYDRERQRRQDELARQIRTGTAGDAERREHADLQAWDTRGIQPYHQRGEVPPYAEHRMTHPYRENWPSPHGGPTGPEPPANPPPAPGSGALHDPDAANAIAQIDRATRRTRTRSTTR